MLWWIWLILALFMVAMIVIGCVYAFRHGVAAAKVVGATMAQAGECVSRMGEPVESAEPQAPFFTQPLKVSLDRYEAAQVDVATRAGAKRECHGEVWKHWDRDPIKVPDFINETDK